MQHCQPQARRLDNARILLCLIQCLKTTYFVKHVHDVAGHEYMKTTVKVCHQDRTSGCQLSDTAQRVKMSETLMLLCILALIVLYIYVVCVYNDLVSCPHRWAPAGRVS